MRRLVPILILLLLVVACLPARTEAARSYLRWAYYVPDDPRSYRSLSRSHAYLDIVAPDAWRVHPDGTITSRIQPAVVKEMRRWGLKVVPMVMKWSWEDKMHSFFQSPAARRTAARTLAALVAEGGYDGIHVDIENILGQDGPALEALVADISGRVRAQGRMVSMAVPARTARYNWHPGFNYARLAAHLDLVVVMAYDHGFADGKPAPVAPLPWVREVTEYSVSQIPRSKLLLGIPWYGYDWNVSTRVRARYVGFDEAAGVASLGVPTFYDLTAHAPSLQYVARGQVHHIWYEDARSVRQKLNIVIEHNLAGWAAWRLGYDDPAIWGLIAPRR